MSLETSDKADLDKRNQKMESDVELTEKSESQSQNVSDSPAPSVCCFSDLYFPRRYIVTILATLGMVVVYCMRTNVGITMITILDEEAHMKVGTQQAKWNLPTVEWNTRMAELLHSLFYIGFFLSQLPSGYLTTKWPCNKTYGACILFSACLNVLLPVSIEHLGYTISCVIRFLQGVGEGFLYPAVYGVLRHWTTTNDRGRLVAAVLTGTYTGAIVGFPISGIITHYISWEYVYYVSSGMCILWYFAWLCFVFEKPSHDTSISQSEFEYIIKNQGKYNIEYENLKVPYRQILTSLPVVSLSLCHFARNWVIILLLTNEPYYLSMFGFSVAENGVYSSIPHVLLVLCTFTSGYIADFLQLNPKYSTTFIRKLLTGIGFIAQAGCFFVLTFLQTGAPVLVVLSLAMGFFGLSVSGWQVNYYDLSSRYANIIVSVSSSFAALAGVITPLVAGEFLSSNSLRGWNLTFYVTGAIVLFAALVFLVFGSGEEQPWANPPDGIVLIQKVDPLARKPYTIESNHKVPSKEEPSHKENVFLDPTPEQINKVVNRMSTAAKKD
ncbi:vesicular glutamate transporter 2-like [Saccostrea echinata]|uniref:vesicular glutamate transporter 2-like n=1 Tax=Saccostrea echinata TaxID=191078 RepID=UPI002A7FF3D7|nr:vesicular glutamate transporter 2-like [Saccostrea echinata]